MRLVIDASNIRAGGGIVYLQNLLNYADPELHDFQKIIVYGGKNPLENLLQKNWLQVLLLQLYRYMLLLYQYL